MTYLNDKVAIVTGAGRGMGFATVQHLLRNGVAYVAIFDVHKSDSETASKMKQTLETEFGKQKFGYYICDVTNDKEFIDCYDKVTKEKGYVDILVNNAGILNEKRVELMISINFTAVVKCTLAAIERMGKHNGFKGGSVVNIGSNYGLIPSPEMPVYSATKHAVVSFVRSMKDHNNILGMRLMCICPGKTKTDMATSLDPKDALLDFVPKEMIENLNKLHSQSPDNVASGIVDILENGKEGEVWFIENDRQPIVV